MNALPGPLFPLALACLALAGCSVLGPDPAPPQPPVPAAWSRLDAAQPLLKNETPAGLAQWWQGLGDPLLVDLVNEALAASPDLRLAQARLREARARRTVAEAARYPAVDAAASARRSRSSEETGGGATRNLFSAGLDASWEADVFGGVRRSVEAAEADLAAAAANLQNTRVSLAAEVALDYVQARALQARLAIARANLAAQSETLQLTEWRAQAGLVSRQDVEQARSNLEQTRAQIPA
ncbi:MAG: TolC family protein, partial [Pseudomonadota bacterium]